MNEMQDRLAKLQARFRERLVDDLAQLAGALEGSPTAEDLVQVQYLSHKLAGISGTLGHPSISAAALALDRDWTASPADLALVRQLFEDLRRSASACLEQSSGSGSVGSPA